MPDGGAPFSAEDIDLLLDNIDHLNEEELAELNELVSELESRQSIAKVRDDLIAFCCHMQSDYKVGNHHRRLASLLEDIEARRKDRICVSVPPRHGKSQMVSIYYAAWYLGKNPTHKIMLVSHTTDLAVDFGRKVRNLINTDEYKEIFPNVELAKDSKSAGRWNTSLGGEFFAAGVGSALAGRGAHLLLVDDPHSEQDILNGNFGVFEKAYEWFAYGARTRLMPGGAVAVVHCMTGDTGVLRPDRTETPLKNIRPGDMIASYDNGVLVSKKVLNWANQGPDHIYTLRMNNGNLIRANARHPFLVVRDGVETWVKVRDLGTGDKLVSLKGAAVKQDQKASPAGVKFARTVSKGIAELQGAAQRNTPPESAARKDVESRRAQSLRLGNALLAYQETPITGKTLTRRSGDRDIGVSGLAKRVALMAVTNLRSAKGCAKNITTSRLTQSVKLPAHITTPKNASITTFWPATASHMRGTYSYVLSRAITALFAKNTLLRSPNLRLGATSTPLQLTTATAAAGFEPCCATPATSSCPANGQSKFLSGQFSTSEIISITPDGVEDVFDIQVEDTENFIANGVVSHNTRWNEGDLIGRLIADMANNEGSDQYEVFEFPAILDTPEGEKALWPEFFDLKALYRTKASMPTFQWNAQYQQKPTAEEAAIVKREWWRTWGAEDPPECEYIIMSLDAAAETHNRADFTSLTTWGVFFNEEEDAHQLILLNAIKERVEFPELKRMCMEQHSQWEPDSFIVEKKSAGVAIYQELRRIGIPVQEYTPHRGTGDKMARLNSVTDIISSGMVWVPTRRWAEELVEEIAGFPFMKNDDQVDSAVMALMRFRQGGFIRLPDDWEDDPLPYRGRYEYY